MTSSYKQRQGELLSAKSRSLPKSVPATTVAKVQDEERAALRELLFAARQAAIVVERVAPVGDPARVRLNQALQAYDWWPTE